MVLIFNIFSIFFTIFQIFTKNRGISICFIKFTCVGPAFFGLFLPKIGQISINSKNLGFCNVFPLFFREGHFPFPYTSSQFSQFCAFLKKYPLLRMGARGQKSHFFFFAKFWAFFFVPLVLGAPKISIFRTIFKLKWFLFLIFFQYFSQFFRFLPKIEVFQYVS